MAINVSREHQNRTVYRAHIDERDLHALALKAVAEAAGLDLAASDFATRVYSTTHSDGSLGSSKPRIVVEITMMHRAPEV